MSNAISSRPDVYQYAVSFPNSLPSNGLVGYRGSYESSLSTRNGIDPVYDLEQQLPVLCPVIPTNSDYLNPFFLSNDGVPNSPSLLSTGGACANNNPYSPKCRGNSCKFIRILAGNSNDFWLTRVRRATGLGLSHRNQNYTNNEQAEVYFPYGGKLTVLAMDIEQAGGDYLKLAGGEGGGWVDLGRLAVGAVTEVGIFQLL